MLKAIGTVRLTKDPELRPVGETHVAKFSVAVNEFYKKNGEKVQQVYYFDCELWSSGAEALVKYVKKGDQIMIDGRLRTDTWIDKETGKKKTKAFIRVDQFEMISNRARTNGSQQQEQSEKWG